MSHQDKQQAYLAKAREAEDFATRCPDEVLRESWLRIAAGYFELARLQPSDPAS